MDFTEIYTEATELYKCGSYKECEELLAPCIHSADVPVEILILEGIVLVALNRYSQLTECIEKIRGRELRTHLEFYNMAYICEASGKTGEAIEYYRKTIELKPDYLAALNNLANLYKATGNISKALEAVSNGIKINPSSYELHNSMGNILISMGKIQESLVHYRKAAELKPEESAPVSNYLLTLNYSEIYSRESICRKHLSMVGALEKLNKKTFTFDSANFCSDKIRIGYLSSDFRMHSVAFFFEPIIYFHDKNDFEIFCYSDVKRADTVTERIKKAASHWTDISNLSDDEVADQIYKDKINILVDLAGHTWTRLKTFIMKPAPVQVTYLGYPNTTGLSSMDYRITDEVSDPPGVDKLYTEKLVRLKKTFLTYTPLDNAPPVSALPALKNKYFTFGSFNNFPKMNPSVLQTWALILKKSPNSRLILKNINFYDESVREYVLSFFKAENISSDRISLLTFENSLNKHLEIYNQIDLALDTFPYNGTTTTFEALWMGVPILTLCGDRHSSRVGMSILSGLDLKMLVAESIEEYVNKAVFYAESPSMAADLRSVLRNMLAVSPFCDAKSFVLELEAFYKDAWRKYLENAK